MASVARRPSAQAIRTSIIEATIRLIGRDGVDGVTHRAVAAEAKVSLSSTTASQPSFTTPTVRCAAAKLRTFSSTSIEP